MAQLVVRNLEDDVKERLRRRADRHGRSMEEEVRAILRGAVCGDEAERPPALGARLAARFAGLGLEQDVPELHGQSVRPADLET